MLDFVLFWDDIEEAKHFAYFDCFNVSRTSERWMPSGVWLQCRLLCGQMPENGEVSSVQLRPKGQNTVSVFNSVVHFLEPFAMKNCRVDDSFDKKKVLISFLTTQSMEKTIKK